MAAGRVILSFHDSLLREEDVLLLESPNWLNDKIIGFYFEYLEKKVFQEYSDRLCLITPDVTQFIKLYEGPELAMFLEPLCLSNKDIIVLAVNSNSSKTISGGSHWSTLVYDRNSNRFEHYDSFGSSNRQEAASCSSNLAQFLQVTSKPEFVDISSPQQENGHDCGVFCVLFAEYSINSKLMSASEPLMEAVSTQKVTDWRQRTQKLIKHLMMYHEQAK